MTSSCFAGPHQGNIKAPHNWPFENSPLDYLHKRPAKRNCLNQGEINWMILWFCSVDACHIEVLQIQVANTFRFKYSLAWYQLISTCILWLIIGLDRMCPAGWLTSVSIPIRNSDNISPKRTGWVLNSLHYNTHMPFRPYETSCKGRDIVCFS